MEISEALNHEGLPYHIEGCTSDDFARFLKDSGCKSGVEIGTHLGIYSEILAQQGLDIYSVDPWGIFPDYPSKDDKFLAKQQRNYETTLERLKPYKNVTIIRKTSMEAAQSFDVESLDFVYIDGNHKFKYVAEDVYEWAKRVKPGGIVAGHDYYNTGEGSAGRSDLVACKNVIDAYVKTYHIKKFYTLAGHVPRDIKHRDRWKSWFWFK